MADELLAGRYLIHEELGRGASATVYRARDTVLERSIALKVIASGLASDPDFARRFEQEARLAARLDHPNVVLVHDVGTLPDGRAFIAMRLLEGKGLDTIITERGQLTPNEVVSIIDQLAAALDYTHSTGLIHRDVKPSNVMMDGAGRATLTDFGIARALDSARVTLPGLTIGTPRYMSPEQVRGEDTSSATDVYSLAVMAYEMMAGRPPFDGDGTSLMYKIVHEAPPPPNTFNPWLPPAVSDVIQRGLLKSPSERWSSAGEFARALREALATSTLGGAALPSAAPTILATPSKPYPTNPPGTSGLTPGSPGTGSSLPAAAAAAATQVAQTGSEPALSAPTQVASTGGTPALSEPTQVSATGGAAAFVSPSESPTEVVVTGSGPALAPESREPVGPPTIVPPLQAPTEIARTGGAQALTEPVIRPEPLAETPPPGPPPAVLEPAGRGGAARPPGGGGTSRKGVLLGGLGGLLLLGGAAVAAMMLLGGGGDDDDNGGSGDDDDGGTATAPAATRTQPGGGASVTASATASATNTAAPGETPSPTASGPTSTPPPGSTNTPIPPTATSTYTPIPGATATNTSVPPTATPTSPPPTETPTTSTAKSVTITGIALNGNRYDVSFTSQGVNPNSEHLGFYFNTGTGHRDYYVYSGLYTGLTQAQKPATSTQMCVAVASNSGDLLQAGTGNCWTLPTAN